MKILTIDKQKLRDAYKTASKTGKALLISIHGKEVFTPEIKYTDINDFDDALSMVKDSHTRTGDTLITEFREVEKVFKVGTFYNSLAKLRIIVFAANGCDESFPDWKNTSQEKRYPWYYMDKPGVGFSFGGTSYDTACATVGSRLQFKDIARCKYICTHENFLPLYKIIFNQ